MADTLKVLGQSNPAAATLTTVYTVPASTSAAISGFMVCNRASTGTTFRIAVRAGGAAIDNKHYIYFDMPIQANDTLDLVHAIPVETGSIIQVYAADANLSFLVSGIEVT